MYVQEFRVCAECCKMHCNHSYLVEISQKVVTYCNVELDRMRTEEKEVSSCSNSSYILYINSLDIEELLVHYFGL